MFNFFKRRRKQKIDKAKTKHIIYMCNHVSKEDFTYLHEHLPTNVHFIMFQEDEYSQNERALQSRKVTLFHELTMENLKKLLHIIESGEPVLLFPEIRVSRSGRIMKIYEEFAFVAAKSNATVYPVIIKYKEQKGGLPLVGMTESAPNVKIGEPFQITDEEYRKELGAAKIYRKLTNLYYSMLHKENVNLFNELLLAAKLYDQNQIIIKDPMNALTYKKLLLTIQVLSSKLDTELSEKRVGVYLPSSIGNAVALFSLFKIGITPAILNFTMGQQTLVECCETANIRTILSSREFISKANLEEVIEHLINKGYKIIYLEDVKEKISSVDKVVGLKNHASSQRSIAKENEVILFTSGSESKPKGVILTHDNLLANMNQAITVMDISTKDRMLNPLPMFHSFGLTIGTFLPLIKGISLVIHPSPIQYKVIPELIYHEDITILLSTPTFLNGYGKNAHPFDFYTVRYAIAGAEGVKEDTKELFQNKFGIRIIEGYGATEASPLISLNTPMYTKEKSVGKIIPGMDYDIEKVDGIEEGGSLLIKGPNIMKGYLIHGKGFVPHEGWYNTGDIVEIDDAGYITIKSRLKRFAKIGGEMVSLNFVEQVAMECFDDIGFAAVSVNDRRKGEKIILYTVNEEASLRELKKFVKAHKHSALLIPAEIEKIEEIPLLGSGKTDYVTLEKMAKETYE